MAHPCRPAARLCPGVPVPRPRWCLSTQTAAWLYCRAPKWSSGETWPWNKVSVWARVGPCGSSPANHRGRVFSPQCIAALPGCWWTGSGCTNCPAHTATATVGIAQPTELLSNRHRVKAGPRHWRLSDVHWRGRAHVTAMSSEVTQDMGGAAGASPQTTPEVL